MSPSEASRKLFAVCVALGFLAGVADGSGPGKDTSLPPLKIKTSAGEALTDDEMTAVVAFMNAHLKLDPKKDRVRVMGARLDDSQDVPDEQPPLRVVTFDYKAGKTMVYVIDLKKSRVVDARPLAGAPVPSKEEIEEAMTLIRGDKEHRKLLVDGELEGGFLVAPREKVEEGKVVPRMLQFQLLSKDRLTLIRLVIVDMTEGRIAVSERPDQEKKEPKR